MHRFFAFLFFMICLLPFAAPIQGQATPKQKAPSAPSHEWDISSFGKDPTRPIDTRHVSLLAQAGNRADPYGSYNFLVEIDGVTTSGFLSVDGLESTSDVVAYREGSEDITSRKLPGLRHVSNIVLRRGLTDSTDLWEWRKKVIDGRTECQSGAIVILNEAREEAVRFSFRGAWPCRYSIGRLDATDKGVAIEEIEMVIEYLERG